MRKLQFYRQKNPGLSIDEFINLGKEEAIKYDFFRHQGVPDRNSMSLEIYHRIYNFYDKAKFSGDTINTYRIAIKQCFNQYYIHMGKNQRNSILEIIKKHTLFRKDAYIFEYERLRKDKAGIYDQICNNYQLGNFCVFPKGFINVSRSQSPYYDFFDSFLHEINRYYEGREMRNTYLATQILKCRSFFDSFDSFENYITENYFQDFLIDGSIIKLYEGEFDLYVKKVNNIIQKRGARIYKVLAGQR